MMVSNKGGVDADTDWRGLGKHRYCVIVFVFASLLNILHPLLLFFNGINVQRWHLRLRVDSVSVVGVSGK